MYMNLKKKKRAATGQNQQSECVPNEDPDQPGHPPSLIRVFAVRMKKAWVLSYPLSAQRRLWSDWATDLSLTWAHTILLVLSCRGSNVNQTWPLITACSDEFSWSLCWLSAWVVTFCGFNFTPTGGLWSLIVALPVEIFILFFQILNHFGFYGSKLWISS